MLQKPQECQGCDLEHKGTGFSRPSGPDRADILLVGEALGEEEAKVGEPFKGPAGQVLDRILSKVGLDRDSVRVDNCIRCRPPDNKLVGAPWEHSALAHCRYLDKTLEEPHKVTVALGATATRRLLGLGKDKFSLNNWHGLPVLTKHGWVVPTYHPSFIMQGNQKHIGTVLFALRNAQEVCKKGWQQEAANLIIDPSPDHFASWMATIPFDGFLSVDIETPEKSGKPEDEVLDEGTEILRINFSWEPGEGLTVPWTAEYLHHIQALLAHTRPQVYWNASFDVPRLQAKGIRLGGKALDFMWAWHILQSDLPRGLGFVAPFYSRFGAWKHLSHTSPGKYAAIDAVQTTRCARGIERDLKSLGQWDAFTRHVYELDTTVLQPAMGIGLPIREYRLDAFDKDLGEKQKQLKDLLGAGIPTHILRSHPKDGWKKKPVVPLSVRFKRGKERLEVAFGAEEIEERIIDGQPRYFIREPFNPDSPTQLLAVMHARGDKPGRAKGTGRASTNKNILERLAREDPFYRTILDNRAITKIRSTYVAATRNRLVNGRVHATFTHKPSTMRLSCVRPNLQNVVSDRAHSSASGFRRCVVASKGCVFLEADYSAIEAVQAGWFMQDPNYIRLAKLGIHAYLTSHLINHRVSLSWSDADLGRAFQEIKDNYKGDYDRAKRVVHATSYGMTADGLVAYYPEIFSRKSATELQGLFFELCPKLKSWQASVRNEAHKLHYLGGTKHPFRYKHWFWEVFVYQRGDWRRGKDANRVVAYLPQSTAAGVLYEAALALANPHDKDYIGDVYFGRTPIRALIHDSILLEVPKAKIDYTAQRLISAMSRPVLQQPNPVHWGIGPYLQIGVAVKIGKDWSRMDKYNNEVGVASDTVIREEDEEDEDDQPIP